MSVTCQSRDVLPDLQIDEILKEALQADCTKYAPGIDIISVRVTKPRLPAAIVANYEVTPAHPPLRSPMHRLVLDCSWFQNFIGASLAIL